MGFHLIDNFIINIQDIKTEELLENWAWLLGKDTKEIFFITKLGDAFLKDGDGHFYWLETGSGELTLIANNLDEFQQKLLVDEYRLTWFLPMLLEEIQEKGSKLGHEQVFSYKKLPIQDGDLSPNNFEPVNIYYHFAVFGELNEQLRDFPEKLFK